MPSHSNASGSSTNPLQNAGRWLAADRKRPLILGGATLLIVGAIIGSIVAGSGGKNANSNSTTTTNAPVLASDMCPLTDTPAPGGKVPQREPIGVKIGNEPGPSRPQSGLNEADIVYDTPAEGGIMRYIAVFQCQAPTNVGPVRSVRWVDSRVLGVFKRAALAFVGGVKPNQDAIAASKKLDNANDFVDSNLYHNDPARTPPDATYTDTAAIWAHFAHQPAPAPVFVYTSSLPATSKPASQVAINFSYGTDVIWKWDAATHQWLHTYSGVPDTDAVTGAQVSTTNIVVQVVRWSYGPYVESTGGTGDIESRVIGKGSGYIFRNGRYVAVTWSRPNESSTTTYYDSNGTEVGLAPGRTWVEFLLNTTYAGGAFKVTP